MSVYANLPIILSLGALGSLNKVVFWYNDGWLALLFELVSGVPGIPGLLFECGRGLSVLVRISIHPCKLVRLLPFMYV